MLSSRAAVYTAMAPHPHRPFLKGGVFAAPTAFEVRGDGVEIDKQGKDENRLVSHLFGIRPNALRGVGIEECKRFSGCDHSLSPMACDSVSSPSADIRIYRFPSPLGKTRLRNEASARLRHTRSAPPHPPREECEIFS